MLCYRVPKLGITKYWASWGNYIIIIIICKIHFKIKTIKIKRLVKMIKHFILITCHVTINLHQRNVLLNYCNANVLLNYWNRELKISQHTSSQYFTSNVVVCYTKSCILILSWPPHLHSKTSVKVKYNYNNVGYTFYKKNACAKLKYRTYHLVLKNHYTPQYF